MARHLENFVSLRPLLPRITEARAPRTQVSTPATQAELTYAQLLSEANLNYFHREFAVAADNYTALRERMLLESHPELPWSPGIWKTLGDAVHKVEFDRMAELARQHVISLPPGDPIVMPTLGASARIALETVTPNPAFQPFTAIKLDAGLQSAAGITGLRTRARALVTQGQLDQAQKLYQQAKDGATARNDFLTAAEIATEAGAMNATYAPAATRAAALAAAQSSFAEAQTLYGQLGEADAQKAVAANIATVQHEIAGRTGPAPIPSETRAVRVRLHGGMTGTLGDIFSTATGAVERSVVPIRFIPPPQTQQTYLIGHSGAWASSISVAATQVPPPKRTLGVFVAGRTQTVALDTTAFRGNLVDMVYRPRINATSLDDISFDPLLVPNFVAYIPHLYFFVLPVCLGDTYVALGRYADALGEYRAARAYPYMSALLEAPFLWQKMAGAYLAWGKELFRSNDVANAKTQLEFIITTNLTVPGSELYSGPFAPLAAAATDVTHQIKGEPHGDINWSVSAIVVDAYSQLTKIAKNKNFFGIGPNEYPIFRYRYLQNVANYLADAAIQTERTFIQFRSTAEQQKLDRLNMQSAVQLNATSVAVEQSRLNETNDDLRAAQQTTAYAVDRRNQAQNALNDWNTLGFESARQDFYLTWAANSSNDTKISFTNAMYEGSRHDFNDISARDFISKIASRRSWIDWTLQQHKLQDQVTDAADEIAIAQSRQQEAADRVQTQQLSVLLAQQRLQGSLDMLNYSQERMFNEDMWFRLAAQLQDMARQYLDMAIYAALLMQLAYELEADRALNIIRTDYGIGANDGLLGGDYLKRDITQFTLDDLQNARKTSAVRVTLSLRNEFPAAFARFVRTGVLTFHTDLEFFDRLYPGSYRRKIKTVEVFVEGLLPLEGASGFLVHGGISREWRQVGGAWAKPPRVLPTDRMILSSYQLRRDLSVFAPSEDKLGLFENLGLQGNWELSILPSGNDIDYGAIADIQLVLYFTSDYNADLAAHLKTVYPATGARSTMLSSRFSYPDQFYRLDVDHKVTFAVDSSQFKANYVALGLAGLAVTVLRKDGTPMANTAVTISRASDNSSVAAATDANGAVAGDKTTMAPFAAWKGASPIDSFTVAFATGVDTKPIGDVQLAIDYSFTYRSN